MLGFGSIGEFAIASAGDGAPLAIDALPDDITPLHAALIVGLATLTSL